MCTFKCRHSIICFGMILFMDYHLGAELTSNFAMWKLEKSQSSVAHLTGTTIDQSFFLVF